MPNSVLAFIVSETDIKIFKMWHGDLNTFDDETEGGFF